jgi:hypothetical protein
MRSRRLFFGEAFVAAAALARRGSGQAVANAARTAEVITPATQRAIDRGLAWLARRQIAAGSDEGAFGHGGYPGGVAVCSLAGLAFMCSGSAPGQGPLGRQIDRCTRFLARCVQESGYISPSGMGQDNMYGHGFAMLYLAEAYGMSADARQDREIGEKLRRAVRLTCDCQNEAGGWRYQPMKNDADLSVTVCQIMGLRAARDAGLAVPDKVREKCLDYVKKSQNADGSFRYQLASGHSTFPLTAAGVVSLYSAGIYEGEAVEKALAWLMRHLPAKTATASSYFFYGHYYAVQAMWHAGGEHWQKWYPAIRDLLLSRQAEEGSWPDQEVCPEFGTAMACIILQLPNNFVPIFAP